MGTPMIPNALLKQIMAQLRTDEAGQMEVPSESHLAFIPQNLRSNVLLMSSQQLRQSPMIPTIFLGTIRTNYNDKMWNIDVANWKRNLDVDAQSCREIQMLPLTDEATGAASNILNAGDAILKIEEALKAVNRLPQGGLSIYLSIGINVRFAAMMADVGDGLL